MTPEQYLALARMSKASVYTNRHYPLRPVVSFSHESWLEFCNKVEKAVAEPQSVVTVSTQSDTEPEIIGYEYLEYRPYGAPGETKRGVIFQESYRMPDGSIAGDYEWLIDQFKNISFGHFFLYHGINSFLF